MTSRKSKKKGCYVKASTSKNLSSKGPPNVKRQAYQLKGVCRLSSSEISKTKLSGFEKAYLEQRVAFFSKQTGPYKMDEEGFKSRTQK
jgi:hypothetical protein